MLFWHLERIKKRVQHMKSLIIKSRPQIVIPELAVKIGLHEALVLQQLHYWITETKSGIEHDGRRWI